MNKAIQHLLIVLGTLIVFSGAAVADGDSDHDRARAAVESGDIVPLSQILEKVEFLYHGSIIEVELEDEEDDDEESFVSGWIYEIKLLTPQGNLLKLKIDARTAQLIRVKGHGEKLARKNIQESKEGQEP
jgi:uncharacterized membrane protein YkoI